MFKRFVIVLTATLMLVGCLSLYRTIYVPHGDAVKLRETIKDVKVWIKTKDGEIIPGKMDLPEGWYCLPLDEESNVVSED